MNLALVQKAARPHRGRARPAPRALAIDPRNAGSHYNLAVVADETGDQATAIEHYRAFLRFGAVTHTELVAQGPRAPCRAGGLTSTRATAPPSGAGG